MQNSFWFGYTIDEFLFPDFVITSPLSLFAVCISTAILVIVYESLKTSRIIKTLKSQTSSSVSFFKLAFSKSTEKSTLLEGREHLRPSREIWRISDLFSHFFELLVGYILMLIAMTYNAYIMISIAVGAGLAYLLFGSVLFNVTAQVVAAKICQGCQIRNADGESTPVIQASNEERASTSAGDVPNDNEDTSPTEKTAYTTVQIHSCS